MVDEREGRSNTTEEKQKKMKQGREVGGCLISLMKKTMVKASVCYLNVTPSAVVGCFW